MKHTVFLLPLLFMFIGHSHGQSWSYQDGENPFDGKYKSSHVKGKGTEFPYNSPLLYVNYFEKSGAINIYIGACGYAGCDNNLIYVKFDDEEPIYVFDVTSNSEKSVWFLHETKDATTDYHLPAYEFLQKLKKHNKVYIRASSDCGSNDMVFSLSGSTKALNYVIPDGWMEEAESSRVYKRYLDLISEAITYTNDNKYEKALEVYQLAHNLVPEDSIAIRQIAKTKERIAKQADLEEKLSQEKVFLVKFTSNIYQEPSPSSETIVNIPKGNIIEVSDTSKETRRYYYVKFGEYQGYLLKSALEEK